MVLFLSPGSTGPLYSLQGPYQGQALTSWAWVALQTLRLASALAWLWLWLACFLDFGRIWLLGLGWLLGLAWLWLGFAWIWLRWTS